MIENIDETEYLKLIIEYKKDIPIWCGQEALKCYQNKELIKVKKNEKDLAVFLIPIDNAVANKIMLVILIIVIVFISFTFI